MDIISILRALQRRIWILIIIPLLSVICAVFLTSRIDKVYKSKAQIATGFTSDETVNLSNEKTSNPFEVNTKFTNTVQQMGSIPVISLVSYRLVLHDIESTAPFRQLKEENITFDPAKETFEKAKTIFADRLANFKPLNAFDPDDKLAASFLKAYGYTTESLLSNFRIGRESTSDFISVEYLSENPMISAFAVNALCQEFIRFNKTMKTDRSSESLEFLESQLSEKRALRDEKVNALNEYKVANNIVNYGADSESKIRQISDYDLAREVEAKKVSSLELSLITIRSKISKLDKGSSNDEIAKTNQRILTLDRQIRELETDQTEAGKSKLARLRDERQLEVARSNQAGSNTDASDLKEAERERDRIELELQIARSNLSSIESKLNQLKYNISNMSGKEARLTDLEREVNTAADDYKAAQEKYNEARSKSLVIGSSLRQILEGQPTNIPEPSKKIMLVGLAGVGSFILCAVVILVVEFANFTIRTPSRCESQTGIRVIGTLNSINSKNLDLRKIFETKNNDAELDMFIHFLRKFRYEVQNANSRVFLIASTKVETGKSFLIVCLAYTLSLLNKRVLIIDTNFKSSGLTKMLMPRVDGNKLLKKGGLASSQYFLKEARTTAGRAPEPEVEAEEFDETSKNGNFIHKTEYKGVDIIGNFGGHDSPSEILAGRDFKEMLKNLGAHYDYIVMEGPSLNEFSDTKELIDYVDKVIPVFDAEMTLNSLDYDSVKYLKSMKGKLLGAVLNRVKLKDLTH